MEFALDAHPLTTCSHGLGYDLSRVDRATEDEQLNFGKEAVRVSFEAN
jgi:hypothetical protein